MEAVPLPIREIAVVADDGVRVVRRRVADGGLREVHRLIHVPLFAPVGVLRHAHPGKPNSSRSATILSSRKPRSSTKNGSSPSLSLTVSKNCAPGPSRHCPAAGSSASAGIDQNSSKPLKWSMRVMSTRSNSRSNRSTHQP